MNPFESIDKCTTCTTCLAFCPILEANSTFMGPKLTGPTAERLRSITNTEICALEYCSNCKNCDISCPSGVKISVLNMLARAHQKKSHLLRDWILAHGHLFAKGMRFIPKSLGIFGMKNPITRELLDKIGIDRRAPLPAPDNFFQKIKKRNTLLKIKKRGEVVYFPGCFVSDYDSRTGLALIDLLEMAGYRVIVADAECCGLPLIANGFLEDAKQAALKNFVIMESLIRKKMPILTTCPSCALMLREEYAEFFPNVPNLRLFSPLIYDACDFIAQCINRGELNLAIHKKSADRLIYHAPCHLRTQGSGKSGFDLLQDIFHNIEDAQAGCCGLSGSYGFKKEKYTLSVNVGSNLFNTIKESNADYVITDCGTCRIQIEQHTQKAALHPLVWLRAQIKK